MLESRREAYLRLYAEAKLRRIECWKEQGVEQARRDRLSRLRELIDEDIELGRRIERFEAVLIDAFWAVPQLSMVGVSVPGAGGKGWTRCIVGFVGGRIVFGVLTPTAMLPDSFLDCDEVDELADADALIF